VETSSCTAEQVDCHSAYQERLVNSGSHTLDTELPEMRQTANINDVDVCP